MPPFQFGKPTKQGGDSGSNPGGGSLISQIRRNIVATVDERLKNKKLTDFECLCEFVVSNSVKGLKQMKKQKSGENNRALFEFR